MKKKGILSVLMLALATALFFLPSCSREDDGTISETDLALAQDEAYADAVYTEIDNMVVSEITTLDGNAYLNPGLKSTGDEEPCYSVTVDHPDSTRFPKVITIDYGDGCTVVFRDDTITRKGQIIITITDRWFMPGAENRVTFNDFYFNDIKVEGTRTITNLGINDKGNLEMGILLEEGKIVFNDTTWMTREADHVREWIRNRTPQNDTVIITGSAHGINVLGQEYSRNITEPLVLVHCRDYKWRWVIVDGTVEITNSVTGASTIDYSAEGCDGTVIINKNGYRHNYEFRYNHRHHKQGGR
ncbi:MAG: hypothetical protein JW830_15265 [Bacteroidales bacterium]|nr:hypothetical protein [Bacteroidales bacterium]